jgi:hypothetical protein
MRSEPVSGSPTYRKDKQDRQLQPVGRRGQAGLREDSGGGSSTGVLSVVKNQYNKNPRMYQIGGAALAGIVVGSLLSG